MSTPAAASTPRPEPDTSRYVSDHQQRLLRVIQHLAGSELNGLAPGEIAKQLGISPPQVTRDLANLRHFGWLETVPETGGRVRLGPEIVQIAMRYMTGLQRAQARLNDLSRYSRT